MLNLKGTYIMNYEKYFGENVMEFAQKNFKKSGLTLRIRGANPNEARSNPDK
jgi:hypothetical protein